jgi:hypothetical protein
LKITVLFAYRTSKQSTTKITPFYLTYEREAKLPVDDLTKNEEQLTERLNMLIDNLPHDREMVRKRIDQQQIKQKKYHDQHVRHNETFKIGDKVLLYKAETAKQWTGKLEPKWKGPFYIHQVKQNGAYQLRTLDGKVLRVPVNGQLLKMYKDRLHWTPMIVIDQ